MNKEIVTLNTSFGPLCGDVYHAPNEKIANVLCVHGGGVRGKKGFDTIRNELAKYGITSYAFDFTGHGETGGDIACSSLEKRVKQVTEIVAHMCATKPVTLLASSMGGYIAIKVSELSNIETLVLIAPAVYAPEAYTLPFGDAFSSAIRTPLSWKKTDAWESINHFYGNLLLLEAEKDQVIPSGIIEQLYNAAASTKSKKLIVFKDATHPLTDWFSEHEKDLKSVVTEITKVLGV